VKQLAVCNVFIGWSVRREFSIYVDSRLVYMGSLAPADKYVSRRSVRLLCITVHVIYCRELQIDSTRTTKLNAKPLRLGQAVLFTRDPNIVRNEKDKVRWKFVSVISEDCRQFRILLCCVDQLLRAC
jgi:hypothetical protein